MSFGTLARALVFCGILAGLCAAQRPAPSGDRPDKPSRMLWWRVTSEKDEAKKIQELESFAAAYPNDEDIGWVYEQLYATLVDCKQFDRALAIAEERKDPALVRKWSQTAGGIARRIVAAAKPAEGN